MEETRYIYFDYNELKDRAITTWTGNDLVTKAELKVSGIVTQYGVSGGREAAMFLVSIEDDKDQHPLMEDLWRSLILDTACEIIEHELRKEAVDHQWQISPLMGPGYGDEPLENTKMLVDSLEGQSIGVSVNSQGVMNPPYTRCGYYYLGESIEDLLTYGCGACCSNCIGDKRGCEMCSKGKSNPASS